MIRINQAQISYRGCDRSPDRAAALSREALTLLARRAPETRGGHIGRLSVEVRVQRNMADSTIAARIADAIARRL